MVWSRMGLRARSMLVLAALLLVGGGVVLVLFSGLSRGIAQRLGEDFAVRHVLWQQARVGGLLARDLALAGKLADSRVIRRWAAAENEPVRRQRAMAELDSYRDYFSSGSWFIALRASNNYYHNDAADSRRDRELVNTMSRERPEDAWFFTALDHEAWFHLNVDHNVDLGITKVWINVAIEDDGRRLGVAGTGVDLSRFIEEFIHSPEAGVSTMLLDPSGAILAHEDPELITTNLYTVDPDQWRMFYDLLDNEDDRRAVRRAMQTVSDGEQDSAALVLTLAGRRQVAALAKIPEIDWLTLALVDLDSVAGVRQLTGLGLLLGGIMLLVVAAMVLLLDRLVLVPIRGAAAGAGQLAAGDYQVRLPAGRGDEIGELAGAFNQMADTVADHTRTLEERVAARTAELREANRQLTAGMLYAHHLQSSLLPGEQQFQRLLPDSFLIWQQRDGVGGDFCLLHADDDHCLLGVADCTGHGVAGALMTMTAHAVFRQVLKEEGAARPGRLLAAVNRRLRTVLHAAEESHPTLGECDSLPAGRLGGPPDNGLEMALCVYNRQSGELTYAGAGLSLYMVPPAAAGEAPPAATMIRGDRHSIGYRRSNPEFSFREEKITFTPGAMYYLATDGILDQVGGPKGISFGNRRFCRLLAALAPLAPPARKAAILEELRSYQGGTSRRDDLTVLGFSFSSINQRENGS